MAKKSDHPNHPLWSDFKLWAVSNGVDLVYKEDWQAWWECFLAGADASEVYIRSKRQED